ncbi:hypothetical protein AB0O91_28420 [Kitasatospora sp. NPDC089797]|uniref:hypothetical protein n=1 Tax=Kitasatospora sp. NPDC089797 TaxID=3155298 RepID=UPI0034283676
MLRAQRARLLAVTLSGAIALAAPTPAGAEDTEPAVVTNGTFSAPTVPSGQTWAFTVDGWTGAGVASATRAAHPQGYQAALTSNNGKSVPLSTRVRGVRAGATVTLTWDDNPDSCVGTGNAKRTYTVTVAGDSDQTGSFTTNNPVSKASWFIGRTYSFTAAEDAPELTFTSTVADNPGCGPLITNVAAKQTAPPLGPPKPSKDNDPCAGDAASSPACKDVADNKTQISKCPPNNKDCLASVAGDGKAQNDGIAKETQAVDDFGKVPRDEDPNQASSDLCTLPDALTDGVPPGDTVVPPHDWWLC